MAGPGVTAPIQVGAGPRTQGQNLDRAPEQPPDQAKRAKKTSLIESQLEQQGAPGRGLGAEAGDPQTLAMRGTGFIERGAQYLSAALPALAPALQSLVANLRVVVPQAMSDQLAGISNAGAGGPAAGTMPAPPPPGPPPMTGIGGGVPPGAPAPGPGGPAVGPPAGI